MILLIIEYVAIVISSTLLIYALITLGRTTRIISPHKGRIRRFVRGGWRNL